MDQYGWQLGHEGKGNVYPDGSIHSWNVDEVGEPHHDEAAATAGYDYPSWRFYITPEGGLHDGGVGHRGYTPYDDGEHARQVVEQHPGLWDARNQVDDAYYGEGGGYGHAQRLIAKVWHFITGSEAEDLSKIAKEEGWADFHTELKLPLSARRKIRKWVDRLKWPEGSSRDDTRRYHITVLSMDEYDEEFAKWARKEMRGRKFRFESKGMAIFADEHVVLKFDCPEWTALVREWTSKAKAEELEPHIFEPPQAHVTIGKSPSGKWPQGVPDPHVKFDTGTFNINKNSTEHGSVPDYWGYPEPEIEPEGANHLLTGVHDFYHYAPTTERERIMRHGLQVSSPQYNPHWRPGETDQQPAGVYVTTEPDEIGMWGDQSMDLWQIPHDQIHELQEDPALANSYVIPHDVHPVMHTPAEEEISWPHHQLEHHYNIWHEPESESYYEDPPAEYQATSSWHVAESTPADELRSWLQGLTPEQSSQPLSIHHTDPEQLQPQWREPVVQAPHIDPPSKPYQPYNWAEEGWEESPMDHMAVVGWEPQIEPQFKRMYHTSPAENRESIEREGLHPRWDSDVDDEPGVFMTGDVPGVNHPDMDIYQVNTDGLNIKQDPWGLGEQAITPGIDKHDELYGNEGGAWYSPDHIPPERITRMAASPDEEMYVPKPESKPITVEDYDPFEERANNSRRPFLYDPAKRHITLGGYGMTHEDFAEGYENPNAIQGEINYAWPPTPIFGYDNEFSKESGVHSNEVLDALRNHTGADIRRLPEWKAEKGSLGPSNTYYPEDEGEYERDWQNKESAIDTHPCPQCGAQIEAQICNQCGYDPQHSNSDYEQAKNEWYERAWDTADQQPHPLPAQPMHWGPRDHATDVRFAAIQWASGDGVCDNCGETQIGKDAEDGVAICSNCGAHIRVEGEPTESGQRGNGHIAGSERWVVLPEDQHFATDAAQIDISNDESSQEGSRHELDSFEGWHHGAAPEGYDVESQDDLYPLWATKRSASSDGSEADTDVVPQVRRDVLDPASISGWTEI